MDALMQRFAFEKRHHEKRKPRVSVREFTLVGNCDNSRVLKIPQYPPFFIEQLLSFRIGAVEHDLHRDLLLNVLVVGAINDSHPASSDLSLHFVTVSLA